MKILLIIVGMAFVTYIPRLIPVFIMDKLQLPSWGNKWLKSIPYAALGALIFPGVFAIEKDMPLLGLVGAIVAAALAYLKLHTIYVILGSIIAVMLMRMYLGI